MGYQVPRAVVVIVSVGCCLAAIPTGAAQQSAMPAACGLLEREAVEQVFGASVGDARMAGSSAAVTNCLFPIKGSGGSISILLRTNPGRAWIAEQEQRMKMGVRYGTYRAAAGPEGKAFVLDMRDAGAALCVIRADYYLQVSVFRAGAAATVLPSVERLAAAALSRLGPPLMAKTSPPLGTRVNSPEH